MPNLTEYTGNAGLGLGSNSDIPAIATKDLDSLNQTADRLQAQNAAQNYAIFQQKVADQDKMYQALDSGQIKVGDILPKDTQRIKDALEKQTEAFGAWQKSKKGFRDIDGKMAYKKATQDAQFDVTHANARYLFDKKERLDQSNDKLQRRQEERQKNLDNVLSNFDNPLTPYQQHLDADYDPFLKYPVQVTIKVPDPSNPLMSINKTTTDVDATLGMADKDFKEDNGIRESQIKLLDDFQRMDPADLKEQLTIMNRRLNAVGTEMKYHQLDPNDPNSPIFIDEKTSDFAAKWGMARNPKLTSQESELDKDKLTITKEANDVRHEKAMEGIGRSNAAANLMRARSYTALQNKKLSQMNNEEKRVKNFWDGITGKVKEKNMDFGGKVVTGDFVFSGDLPEGYQFIGGIGADGKPIKLLPKTGPKGTQYYDTKFYDSDGGEVDLRSQYNEYKAQGGKGSYQDLRTNLLRSGKINMELVGENGVGNFETAYQTARTLSNKATSKGEEPIFGEEVINEQQ